MAKWKDETMAELLAEVQGESRTEVVELLPINSLVPFHTHPFKPYAAKKMAEMVESIQENGVVNPLIVRRKTNGKQYEIIAGHNRWEASRRAGLQEVPAIVKDVDDATASIIMVDTNFNQRDEIAPSERAYAYKIKLDALKQQGKRTDLTSAHSAPKLTARERIAQEEGESKDTISRYIRLTELIPELLDMVDEGNLGFIPAVDLSYLTEKEQKRIYFFLSTNKKKITKAMAAECKGMSQQGLLTDDALQDMFQNTKDKKEKNWNISSQQFLGYLPEDMQKDVDEKRAEEILSEAVSLWLALNDISGEDA